MSQNVIHDRLPVAHPAWEGLPGSPRPIWLRLVVLDAVRRTVWRNPQKLGFARLLLRDAARFVGVYNGDQHGTPLHPHVALRAVIRQVLAAHLGAVDGREARS